MTDGPVAPAGDVLWLLTYRELIDRLAHEIRNPLNGALLSLAVVQQRLGRADLNAVSLAPFADSAAAELERASAIIDALLKLAQRDGGKVDLWTESSRLALLYGAIAKREGGSVALARHGDASADVEVESAVARLAVGSVLAAASSSAVECTISRAEGGVLFSARGEALQLPARVRNVLQHAGVTIACNGNEIDLTFPAAYGAG